MLSLCLSLAHTHTQELSVTLVHQLAPLTCALITVPCSSYLGCLGSSTFEQGFLSMMIL